MNDTLATLRGRRGGIIVTHRGLRALRCSRSRVAAAVVLALGLTALWIVAWNPVMHAWTRGLRSALAAAGLPAAATVVRHELPNGWHLVVPQIELAPHPLTPGLWWGGAIACGLMLVASFVLPRRWLPLLYLLRLIVLLQGSAQVFFWRAANQFPYDVVGYTQVLFTAGGFIIGLAPILYGFTLFPLDLHWRRKLSITLLAMGHLALFVPLQYLAHALLLHHGSLLFMPLLFWLFGMPLDILVLVALFSWAASWQPLPQLARPAAVAPTPAPPPSGPRARTPAVAAVLAALALGAAATPAAAQLPGWELGAEVGGSFGRYSDDLGDADAQFARLRAGRPWKEQWQFEVGRAARFNDQGIGLGMAYRRHLRRDTRWSVGASTGTGDVLFPRWRVDLGLDHGLLAQDRLIVAMGYMHAQSKAENSVDGFSTGLTLYGPRGWIASAFGRIDIGHPGQTTSRSGGFGLMWNQWRRWTIDSSYEAGDVSYVLVAPGNALVNFQSQTWRVGASAYLGERWGISARYEQVDADVYDLWTVGGHVFVEW